MPAFDAAKYMTAYSMLFFDSIAMRSPGCNPAPTNALASRFTSCASR